MKCPLEQAFQEAPANLAVIAHARSFSFHDLHQEADRLSLQLEHLGVKSGDRIAVIHPNCPRLIALFFAVWRLGASICPLNLRLPPKEIASCLQRLSPKLFISSFPINSTPLPSSPAIPQSLFLFTSGSTGVPKIAVLTLDNLLANAQFSIPLESRDLWLLSLPLFHVGGIGIMLRCILAKAAIVLEAKHPEITHVSYVPTQLYRKSPSYKNLKCLLLGGAPIDSYDPRLPIYATYGLTEMGSMVAMRRTPPKHDDVYFLGPPLPNRELSLLEDGEICVRGKTLFQGYWEEGIIHSALKNGWFPTGDLGRYDSQEGLAIVGRKDWQFISGGENIQPEEIERHLLQMPGIVEAAIIPQPDAEFGMRPAACIQTTNKDVTLQQIRDFLSDFLPKYKLPAALFIFDELPKTRLKTDRTKLNKSLFI